jgi:hypothetical protein
MQATGDLRTASAQGTPRVAGVRTSTEGRVPTSWPSDEPRVEGPAWLAGIGARAPHEEQMDSGFTYYTRYFQGSQPQRRGPTLMSLGTISLLTLPGDNETWSVTIFASSGDQPLRSLRQVEKWTNTIRACPLHAHWLGGEPITDVLSMSAWLIDAAVSCSTARPSRPGSSQ